MSVARGDAIVSHFPWCQCTTVKSFFFLLGELVWKLKLSLKLEKSKKTNFPFISLQFWREI
jgi:hypothetical protein